MQIAAIIFCIFVFSFKQTLAVKGLPAHIDIITFQYPPYMFSAPDLQGRRGLELDILGRALKNSGVATRFEVYPIPRSVFEFRKKAASLGSVVYVGTATHFTSEISKGEYASLKIGAANFVPYVNTASPLAKASRVDVQELRKRTVVVPRGSSVTDALTQKKVVFQEVSSFEQMFRMLAHQRVEVAILIDLAGDDQLERLPSEISKRVLKKTNVIYTIPLNIVVAQSTPQGKALAQYLQKRLKEMSQSGELKKIADQYFKKSLMPEDFLKLN